MNTPTLVAVAPPCTRCHGRGWYYLEAGPDCWPYEIPCVACSDQGDDDPDDDAGMWNDDVAASSPDDASRWAAVAFHYPAA